MKSKPRCLSLVVTASLIAPFALAQSAQSSSASTASQTAAAAAGRSSAAHAHASAANASAVSAANRPAVSGATSTAATATTAAGASIPTTKGTVNAGIANSTTSPAHPPAAASAHDKVKVHGTIRAPGLAAEGNPGGNISAALNSQATAAHIRNATRETRDKVLADVESNVETSRRSVAGLREPAHGLKKESHAQLKVAAEEIRVRDKALRESLKAARKASGDQIPAAQARLAADYEGYATAVAMTESAVNGSVSTTVNTPR